MEASQAEMRREAEARDAELAERLAAATLEQLQHKVSQDMQLLSAVAPSTEKEAYESCAGCEVLEE